MKIDTYYHTEIERFLDQCIQCGICADECPVLPYTDISHTSSSKIQQAVFDSIASGRSNNLAYTKAFACMECFKCTTNVCPRDLNPMLVNEIIKGAFIEDNRAGSLFRDNRDPDSLQRIVASVQVTGAEYRRITTPTPVQEVKYLLFPGCNVYFQPEKILNVLDIFETVGDSYAFLPGLDYCCSDNHLFFGLHKQGSQVADELLTAIGRYNPDTVVLWCPTCHCRFDKIISPSMDVPFQVVSFPQYLSKNMDKLPLSAVSEKNILTLHEPCKSAFTGVDPNGTRQVISQLSGVELREMEHHGADTKCCGSGAICWFPDSCDQISNNRLREAEQTGANQLVTVCHFCNQIFAAKEADFGFDVVNYVSLVAGAMGIDRQDKFKKYAQFNDLELILNDIGTNMDASPFEKEQITDALQKVFIR